MRRLICKRKKFIGLFLFNISLGVPCFLHQPRQLNAAVPGSFTYQGSLKQSGTPFNGTVTMLFQIYDGLNGSIPKYALTQSVPVKEGLYKVELTPTSIDLNALDPYLQITINGTATLSPREHLTSSPYALMSKDLAAGATAKGDLTINGKLSGYNSSAGAVSTGLRINNPNRTTATGASLELSLRPEEDYNWRMASIATNGTPNALSPKLAFSLNNGAGVYTDSVVINPNGDTSFSGKLSSFNNAAGAVSTGLRLANRNNTSGTGTSLELALRPEEDYGWRMAAVATSGTPNALSPKLAFSVNNGVGAYTDQLVISQTGQAQVKDGSMVSPTYSFLSDAGTGLYTSTLGGSRWMAISLGGALYYQFASMALCPRATGLQSLGASSSMWTSVWASNGVVQTSSSRQKKEIREISFGDNQSPTLVNIPDTSISLPPSQSIRVTKDKAGKDEEEVVGATGVTKELTVPRGIVFKWKDTKNSATANADVIGFLGDDLPIEAHALRDDGTRDPESFYTSAVVGILCAKVRAQDSVIKDLVARLAVLEKK